MNKMARLTATLGSIVILALGALTVPPAADAQPLPKIPRIGVLASSSPSYGTPLLEAFRQGLRDLGYRDVVIEARWAEGRLERLPDLATELVRLKVDIIISAGTAGPLAAKHATSTIPIVMIGAGDPVASGLVASLARPGGNVTGTSMTARELGGKRLQLLKEAVPGLSRVAVLWNPLNPDSTFVVSGTEMAARTLGIQVQSLEVRSPEDFDIVFAGITRGRADALMTVDDPLMFVHAPRIVDFATKSRRPAIYGAREYAEGGGLMAYGPRTVEAFRRTLTYVDRILKGAKPAELPVMEPTQFELVINLHTAKALGLTIPQSLLLQADRVVQ
jgi:putative ABC transport system substrate-binding protein